MAHSHDPNRLLARIALLSLATTGAAGQQVVMHVDDDAPPGGDGRSWSTAFDRLDSALVTVRQQTRDVQIKIAQGVYKPPTTSNNPRGKSFKAEPPRTPSALQSAVVLRLNGGFAGVNAANPDLHDPGAFTTVLSADHLGNDDLGDPSTFDDNAACILRVNTIEWEPNRNSVLFENLVFRAGRADLIGSIPAQDRVSGAAVRIVGENERTAVLATFAGCRFENNEAVLDGGAIYTTAPINIDGCQFVGNASLIGAGGAVRADGARLKAYRNEFFENQAWTGGALAVDGDGLRDVLISRCVFGGNFAADRGGAMQLSGLHYPEMRNCLVVGNAAIRKGGAISVDSGILTLQNFTIADNEATEAPVLWGGSVEFLRIVSTIVWGNQSVLDRAPVIVESVGAITLNALLVDESEFASTDRESVIHNEVVGEPEFVDWTPNAVLPWVTNDYRQTYASPGVDSGVSGSGHGLSDLDGAARVVDDLWTPNAGASGNGVDLGPYELPARCSVADVAPTYGILDYTDINTFIDAFLTVSPLADLNRDGHSDAADIFEFVDAFVAGCDPS